MIWAVSPHNVQCKPAWASLTTVRRNLLPAAPGAFEFKALQIAGASLFYVTTRHPSKEVLVDRGHGGRRSIQAPQTPQEGRENSRRPYGGGLQNTAN